MSEETETPKSAAVASRLDGLVGRFEAMAEVREEHARELRMNREEKYASIAGLESAAAAYRRCAEEVRRVISGETPPPPNYRWNETINAVHEPRAHNETVRLNEKLNGLFCPVHGAGTAVCNCLVPPPNVGIHPSERSEDRLE